MPAAAADRAQPGAEGTVEGGAGWVPYREAARQAEVSEKTLRNWHQAGKVQRRYVPGPNGQQVEVLLDEVLAYAAAHARRPRGGRPRRAGGELIPLREVTAIIDRVDQLLGRVDEADRERRRAEFAAERAQAEVARLRERLAALEAAAAAAGEQDAQAGRGAGRVAGAAPAPRTPVRGTQRRWWGRRGR